MTERPLKYGGIDGLKSDDVTVRPDVGMSRGLEQELNRNLMYRWGDSMSTRTLCIFGMWSSETPRGVLRGAKLS